MKDNRPVNLDLTKMKFPITAIVSILHRVSGVLTLFLIPLLLCLLAKSLRSPDDFAEVQNIAQNKALLLVIWVFVSAFIYHFVAGVRHLLMDLGKGESLKGGRFGAVLVFVIACVLILAMGYYLWV